MPQLAVGDLALSLLVDLAPLFSDFRDKLPRKRRVFDLLGFSIAVDNGANENGNDEQIKGEVEGEEKDHSEQRLATPILSMC